MCTSREHVTKHDKSGTTESFCDGGYDVSSTTVYHPSGTKMKNSDLATLICPKCTKMLREPVQLITCGCRYCSKCIDTLLANESSLKCPVDATTFSKKHVRKDKGCVKEINLLQVDCPSKCPWKGLLIEAEDHVRLHCPNTELECGLGCGEKFLRSQQELHTQECKKQPVSCSYCSKSVTKDELEDHEKSVCPAFPIVCDFCHDQLPRRSELQRHIEDVCTEYEMVCPLTQMIGCDFKGKRATMTQHVQLHTIVMCEKVDILWGSVQGLTAEKHQLTAALQERDDLLTKLGKAIEDKNEEFNTLKAAVKEKDELITRLDDRVRNLEMNARHGVGMVPDAVEVDGMISGKVKAKGVASARSFGRQGERVAIDGGPSDTRQLGNLIETSENNKIQIRQLSQSVQMLQENVTQQTIAVDELRLRQDILDVRTTNGVFIWKIPDIRRRYREAIDRRTVSIYSPPYFTSPQGYRMCTRVYLNGDGIGKGTHISVFFVLMRSEHDNLLQWPFKQSVRFTLINQVNQSASITEAFAPDLESPSFQQPENEMNIASGFPKFAKQSVLQDENFTKGNTIYIKAQVDLSGLAVY